MRVLIAGATGVIGRQAVYRLAAAGHDVIGLSRASHSLLEMQHVSADLLDGDALAAVVRSAAPDAVVHLATALPDPVNPRQIARDMARTNRLRTEGTANLLEAAHAAGVNRIIGQSLAYVYDPAAEAICDKDQPLWREPPKQYAPAVAALRELERRVTDADGVVLIRPPLRAGQHVRVRRRHRRPDPQAQAADRRGRRRDLVFTMPPPPAAILVDHHTAGFLASSTTSPRRCANGSPR